MKKLVLLIFMMTAGFSAYSQPVTGKQTYSLRECLDIALKNNPEIKLAYSQVGLASADLTSAFGDFLPSIRANSGYTRQLNADGGQTMNIQGQTFNVGKVEPNSYNMSVGASLNIFNGFQRERNYSRAQDVLNSTYLNIKYIQQKVLLSVYRLYVETVRNSQLVKIRKDNFELGLKNQEKIKAKYEAGAFPLTNVIAGEADLSERELALVQAENTVSISKSNLLTSMGLFPDITVEFQESSLPSDITIEEMKKFRNESGGFESNVQEALNKRDDYQATKLQISAAKTSIAMANASYYPTLGASGGWSWANSDLTDFSKLGRSYIGLSLSIPIFENFKVNYQVESSKLQLIQAELQQFQLEQSIRGALKNAFINLEAAEKQLELSVKSISAAQRNFDFIQEGMKVGSVSNSDYYIGNNLFLNAQINRISAIYNYYQAQKELLFAVGKLSSF